MPNIMMPMLAITWNWGIKSKHTMISAIKLAHCHPNQRSPVETRELDVQERMCRKEYSFGDNSYLVVIYLWTSRFVLYNLQEAQGRHYDCLQSWKVHACYSIFYASHHYLGEETKNNARYIRKKIVWLLYIYKSVSYSSGLMFSGNRWNVRCM